MFTLPGKKHLQESDAAIDLVVIDVTETPIERPKKNKNISLVEKRKDIPLSLKPSESRNWRALYVRRTDKEKCLISDYLNAAVFP